MYLFFFVQSLLKNQNIIYTNIINKMWYFDVLKFKILLYSGRSYTIPCRTPESIFWY